MYGRRLAILIAGNCFVATSFMSVAGLLNEISESLNISVTQAGSLIAAFALTAGCCAPVLATFGSRIDRRNLLAWSLGICAIANVIAALSENYPQLMAARVLAAVTSAVYTPQVAATVSMLVKPEERGPVLGKLMMGWAIGAVLGQPLNVWIGSHFGWRVSMACVAAGCAVIALLVWRTVPPKVEVPPLNLQRWIEIARSPALRILTLATAFNAMGNHVVFSYLAPAMKALHDAGGSVLASLFFVNGLGGVAGSLFSVAIVSRVGAHRVALYSIALVMTIFIIWPLLGGMLVAVFAMQFLWSAGIAGFPSVQQTRLVAIAPTLAAATIAMNSSVGYLGNSIGTTLGGTAWAIVGPRYMTWVGLTFICASLWCSIVGERAARREPQAN